MNNVKLSVIDDFINKIEGRNVNQKNTAGNKWYEKLPGVAHFAGSSPASTTV